MAAEMARCSDLSAIHIVLATNASGVGLLRVALYSIFRTSSDPRALAVHVFASGLSAADKSGLRAVAALFRGGRVDIVDRNADAFSDVACANKSIPPEACLRFLIPDVLRNAPRAIYLDIDVLCRADIAGLWDIPMDGAVCLGSDKEWAHPAYARKIGLGDDDVYINSGVMVWDLRKFREEGLAERMIEAVRGYGRNLPCVDQDVINLELRGRIGTFSHLWNYTTFEYKTRFGERKSAKLLHFTNIPKPWNLRSFGWRDREWWCAKLGMELRLLLARFRRPDDAADLPPASYFRSRPPRSGDRRPTAFDRAAADRAARGELTVVNVPHAFAGGRIDWLFNPTKKQGPFNPEWTWQLNRMEHWKTLADAYACTGDERYARAFAAQLKSWLDQTGGVPSEKGFNDVGSPWRTIEEGLRLLGSWTSSFETFRSSLALDDRLLLRFVVSMRRQARHLMAHRTACNWLLMEMNGVYAFAAHFPELAESVGLRDESMRVFVEAARSQLLPDGLHNELSPDYNAVFIRCAARMYALAKNGGYPVSDELKELLSAAIEGPLALMTPGFVQPRFNDCYTIETEAILGSLAELFPDRMDLRWAVTRGREGCPPAGETASRILPWAGFAAMRSGWTPDAAYLAFDFGPLGAAHMHADKLSFTMWKGDEELVFDDGGGQYEKSPERAHACSGYGHNTLLVDGMAQTRTEPKVSAGPIDAGWESSSERDYVRGTYDQEYGLKGARPVRHVREITFSKPETFRIVDTVESKDGNPHRYDLLFQLDTTTVEVSSDGRSLRAKYGRKWDLCLEVEQGGSISLSSGSQGFPRFGWYMGRNDKSNHPATTVHVRPETECTNCTFITNIRTLRA